MKNELLPTTIALLKDLQEDISRMMKMESNMEVVWKLESMQTQELLKKTASLIKDSIS